MKETPLFILKLDDDKNTIFYYQFIFCRSLPQVNYSDFNFFFYLNPENLKRGFTISSSDNPTMPSADWFNYASSVNKGKISPESSITAVDLANNFFTKYLNKKKFSFTNFFIDNLIDVPICFKKSDSIKRKTFTFPILKFPNYFMKNGNKEKINISVFSTLSQIIENLNKKTPVNVSYAPSWFHFYSIFNENFYFSESFENSSKSYRFDTELEKIPLNLLENVLSCVSKEDEVKKIKTDKFDIELPNLSYFVNSGKKINTDYFYKNVIKNLFFKIAPIFSFFIYSVDKNIKKFSRGKAGKYVFLWKYIAPHKRHYLIMKLIAKDCKFYQHKKLKDRLVQTFSNILLNENKNFVSKSKTFSHNYVFKNFKKTLFTSYKTVS